MVIRPQSKFPLLEEYRKHFKITPQTIFAYDNCIYCNYDLPYDLLIHEQTHLEQQKRDGLDYWVTNYLNDPKYRLAQELEAYTAQLQSIKDRNWRAKIRMESATNLSSDLYGDMLSFQEALNMLK